MTPGGIHLILEGPTSGDEWWALIFEVRQHWPDAIVHRTEPDEASVYRDQEAFQEGLSGKGSHQGHLRVLMGPESLTLVIDAQPTEAGRVGQEVFTALQGLREG